MNSSPAQTHPKSFDFKAWLVFLSYVLLITLISFYHEIWRDEAVLINILRDSSSLGDFYAKTQNYGHPRLWHTLLYLSYQIFPHYSVIKILNTTICASAMLIFLKFSPFRLWQKALFALGVFPIYIYPAFNRSYGLCMLLMFVLAVFYKNRWRNIIPVSLTLILLANTHAHTLIITMAVLFALMWEYGKSSSLRTVKNTSSLLFVIAGIILSIFQIIPDPTTHFTNVHAATIPAILKALAITVVFPGKIFDQTFGAGALFSSIIMYATVFYLSNKKHLLTIFALSILGLGLFSILFYPSDGLRHQGFVFLIFIFSIWLAPHEGRPEISQHSLLSSIQKHLEIHRNAYIAFLFILQICSAYPLVRKDILENYSSAKPLSAFLAEHPELNDAIFIPEPDYLFESAPYYKPDIKIFLPRESAFRSYVQFTSIRHQSLSLDELLTIGETLRKEKNAPVVFAINHPLSENGPYTISLLNNGTFSFSKESLETFKDRTLLIAEFHDSIKDENYDLYLLKHPHNP